MTEHEHIEQEIRQVLASSLDAISLSNRLFSPTGLFNQLARTEEERRQVAQSDLFRQAQRQLTQLQRREADEFARVVQQTQDALPERNYLLKLERTENP